MGKHKAEECLPPKDEGVKNSTEKEEAETAGLQALTDSLNQNPATLLLLVWTILGDDNKEADLLSIDRKGLKFELTNRAGVKRVERYEFDVNGTELSDEAAVRKEVASLQTKAKVGILPMKPGMFVTLLLWLIILCGTCETEGKGSQYVQALRKVAHAIFQSADNSWIALYVMLAAHFCEAVYAWTLMSRMQLCTFSKLSWASLIVFIGYPVTALIIYLHKYWLKRGGGQSSTDSKKDN